MPFPLTEWAAVFTLPCPIRTGVHVDEVAERGLLWAHYCILREFVYFPPEVLYQAQRLHTHDTDNHDHNDKHHTNYKNKRSKPIINAPSARQTLAVTIHNPS
jgi:hypothetical protein